MARPHAIRRVDRLEEGREVERAVASDNGTIQGGNPQLVYSSALIKCRFSNSATRVIRLGDVLPALPTSIYDTLGGLRRGFRCEVVSRSSSSMAGWF